MFPSFFFLLNRSYCEREFRDCRLQTCYVQSPAYPGLYPRSLKCRYRLHTRQPFIKLYLQNEHFSVDGQRCENIMVCPMREIGSGSDHCPYDWLAVYDGRDEHAPLIGKFCGMGKFPFSIIGMFNKLIELQDFSLIPIFQELLNTCTLNLSHLQLVLY